MTRPVAEQQLIHETVEALKRGREEAEILKVIHEATLEFVGKPITKWTMEGMRIKIAQKLGIDVGQVQLIPDARDPSTLFVGLSESASQPHYAVYCYDTEYPDELQELF